MGIGVTVAPGAERPDRPAPGRIGADMRLDLVGGDAQRNAEITRSILSGEMGAKRDIVLLNAASCFVIAGKAASIADGILLAAEMIDSKKADAKLKEFIRATNEVSR